MDNLVFIKTYGCQMNVYDTSRILQVLKPFGFRETDYPEKADLILINTCSVREKPERKLYSALGRYKKIREIKPDLLIGVCGCVAQQEKEKLFNNSNSPDLIVGTDHIDELPELLKKAKTERKNVSSKWEFGREENDFIEVDPSIENNPTTFLTIMKGCSKVCSFCVVPYVRGPAVSKKSSMVLKEVDLFVENGVKEVTLLGQNVNSYGKDREGEMNFAQLLHAVSKIEGLQRLRFLTSHPVDCSDELLYCFKEIPNLCEYFHLPVQSGSDRILKKMRRDYTNREYMKIIEKLKKIRPDISLSTDIIVGFPSETDEDFRQTINLLKHVEFDTIFSFKYSKRPNTTAARLKDDVANEVKTERLNEVHFLQESITAKKMVGYYGKKVEVLVEGLSERSKQKGSSVNGEEKQWMGRTSTNFIVNFTAEEKNQCINAGNLVKVKITNVLPHSLQGIVEKMKN